MSSSICLEPIGLVECSDPQQGSPFSTVCATIRIYEPYRPGLLRIAEHSHLWVLSWFHQAVRDQLQVRPRHFANPEPFGVFSLRSPTRPNPIALSLVRLERVEEDRLIVTGLDAFDGTPVLDIKPYFEHDVIFSPTTPYIPPGTEAMRRCGLWKQAVAHHRENCADLELAVQMALLVEERLGKLQADDLLLAVKGSPCLADVLQGLTRARLASPPRFRYVGESPQAEVVWTKGNRRLRVRVRPDRPAGEWADQTPEQLFWVDEECDV